jgi:Ca2+-binding EF-hand superfamily protein
MNWRGDVRALWKALDHDGSGTTTFEELDPHCAQLLAQFKHWAEENFGAKPATKLWQAIDRQRRRKLTYSQFAHECEARSFHHRGKTLAKWLDWQDKRYVVEEDIHCIDAWRAPEWLFAKPNKQAAENFKVHLKNKYGHLLKAWRVTLDKDNSNCCNWHEFQEAAKHARWPPNTRNIGDIAGAWLALDEDLSGFITLKEIDSDSHEILLEFKRWAEEEFGGVKSAFRVLDADNSGELTFDEFRRACRNYGYHGDVQKLFNSLDQHGEMKLQYKEVCFLDDWEDTGEIQGQPSDGGDVEQAGVVLDQVDVGGSNLLDYRTPVPGPGAYDVRPIFGAMPREPTVRHSGAFSFSARCSVAPRGLRPLTSEHSEWLLVSKTLGPANYDVSTNPTTSRKPAWGFGPPPKSARGSSTGGRLAPGPGSYDVKSSLRGPSFSMKPRRGLVLHPSQTVAHTPERPERYATRSCTPCGRGGGTAFGGARSCTPSANV